MLLVQLLWCGETLALWRAQGERSKALPHLTGLNLQPLWLGRRQKVKVLHFFRRCICVPNAPSFPQTFRLWEWRQNILLKLFQHWPQAPWPNWKGNGGKERGKKLGDKDLLDATSLDVAGSLSRGHCESCKSKSQVPRAKKIPTSTRSALLWHVGQMVDCGF